MTEVERGRQTRLPIGRWLSFIRMLVIASALGLTLGILSLLPLGGALRPPATFACGIGNNSPTMLANGTLALQLPQAPNVNGANPGVFAPEYTAGQPIRLTEDLSRVPNAPPLSSLTLRWSFGDGTPRSAGTTVTHSFARPGTYQVQSEIYTPGIGWDPFDVAQIQIIAARVANPPVAHVVADRTAILVGQPITFDTTGSHALVGPPTHLKYFWNFNDGSTGSGPHVTHSFGIPGQGLVALIVTDDRGARSVATIDIGIVTDPQQIPTASLAASATQAQVGQAIDFDASQSAPASGVPGDQITKYTWDFGDGTPSQTTQAPTISHAFQQPGGYRVALQVIDQQGIPAQATLTMSVSALGSVTRAGSAGRNWLLIGGVAALLLMVGAGGYYALSAQRRQAALARQRAAAMELRRARRIPQGGVRPGDPRWGEPRAGARASSRSSPPSGARGPYRGGAPPRDPRRGPPPAEYR